MVTNKVSALPVVVVTEMVSVRHGWRTIGEAQRYVEMANKMKLADNAAAKIISSTKIVSAADSLRQFGKNP